MTIEEFLQDTVKVHFKIWEVSNYHFSVEKKHLTREYGIDQIVAGLRTKFPWAMMYDETPEKVKFVLA